EVLASGTLTRSLSYSGFGEVDLSEAAATTSTGVVLTSIPGGRGGPQVTAESDPDTTDDEDVATVEDGRSPDGDESVLDEDDQHGAIEPEGDEDEAGEDDGGAAEQAAALAEAAA